jgi:hypothetical protein
MPIDSSAHIVAPPTNTGASSSLTRPTAVDVIIHTLIHLLILASAAFTLHALWLHASRALFGVFLAWIVCFYVVFLLLTWRVRPPGSILSTCFNALQPRVAPSFPPGTSSPHPVATSPLPVMDDLHPPSLSHSPYIHQPTYRSRIRRADDQTTMANGVPTSHEGYFGDDEVEDTEDDQFSQERIEAEMNRRQVSIVTVPRQRLFIANAS